MGRRAIVLLVALILAGLAAWAVWNYLQNVENEIIEGQEIVEVYRAGEAIAEGTDGAILLSDFNSGGTLITLSEDQAEGSVRDGDPVLLARSVVLACHGFALSAQTMAEPGAGGPDESDLEDELRTLVDRYLRP